jgi:hypothetical protein
MKANSLHVLEGELVANAESLAIDEENVLAVLGLDREVVAPAEQVLFHRVAHGSSVSSHHQSAHPSHAEGKDCTTPECRWARQIASTFSLYFQAHDFTRFAFSNHFRRSATNLTIGRKSLRWNARIHHQIEALTAI